MNDKPAILGGAPLLSTPMTWTWPPRLPEFGDILKHYYQDGKPLSIQGRNGIIANCEDELCHQFHRRHAILCSSGTMALYSAFFALDLQPGDEVISTTITYHATVTPALHFGAHVVLADVEPDTGNISVADALSLVTPRTRAMVTNALWGRMED